MKKFIISASALVSALVAGLLAFANALDPSIFDVFK